MRVLKSLGVLSLVVAATCLSAAADDEAWGLKKGDAGLKSATSLAMGPDGILFVGDTKAAHIVALSTGDKKASDGTKVPQVPDLTAEIAKKLQAKAEDMRVVDIAANPLAGCVYVSVEVGSGDASEVAIARVGADSALSFLNLADIAHAKNPLPEPPEDRVVGEGRRARNLRGDAVTDLAFVNGRLLLSGVAGGEAGSRVFEMAFPFVKADPGTTLEIYHAAHGRSEDYAAIRTFVPFNVNGEPSLLAGFVCTPLVQIPIDELAPGKRITGKTVAELGNRNQPIDMIVYQKDGKEYLLLANSARGVMKITTEGLASQAGLTEPVRGGGVAGQKYETIESMAGVVQMDKLNDDMVVALIDNGAGKLSLSSVELP